MLAYLADKSALARLETSPRVRKIVDPFLVSGQVATCGIVDLELLYSAPSPEAYAVLATTMRGLPRVPVTEVVLARALEVQGQLAERSQHRGMTMDLIIAACAESAGLTVMHYDADFERIASITGQPVQWVVPRGSVA